MEWGSLNFDYRLKMVVRKVAAKYNKASKIQTSGPKLLEYDLKLPHRNTFRRSMLSPAQFFLQKIS